MKRIKIIIYVSLVSLILSACASTKTSTDTINEVSRQIELKDFTIDVNYAQPLRGKQIYLNYNYDLTIRNDSAIAYLPYYGRAQIAPINPLEGGINFAEPVIDYKMMPKRKGDGWDITFRVNDREYRYDFSVSIFNNGNASFTVNSFQRDAISFTGNIKELKTITK